MGIKLVVRGGWRRVLCRLLLHKWRCIDYSTAETHYSVYCTRCHRRYMFT